MRAACTSVEGAGGMARAKASSYLIKRLQAASPSEHSHQYSAH